MIIDFHTHVFPDRIAGQTIQALSERSHILPSADGTAKGLSQSMKKAGIDLSINLPVLTRPEQTDRVNNSLLRNKEEMIEMGILTFGGMHPAYEDYREKLRLLAAEGIKGIKLHPAYQGTDLDDISMMRVIDTASECGLITLIHAGLDIGIPGHDYSSVKMILRILDEVKPEKLVLAHMGGWKGWKEVKQYLAGANVWMDTAFSIGRIDINRDTETVESEGQSSVLTESQPDQWLPSGNQQDTGCIDSIKVPYNMDPEALLSLCRKHGMDRILFATDCPWADQKAYVDAVRALPLSEAEQAAVLGGNAEKLLGL